MKTYINLIVCFSFFGLYIAPPLKEPPTKGGPDFHEAFPIDGLNDTDAQSIEYFRYLNQVFGELEKDPVFQEKIKDISQEDITSGKVADILDFVGHDVRMKMDEVKRMEVEYQRELLRKQKHHMLGVEENYWNPIHHENQDSFEKEDMVKLLHKHNDVINEQDRIRHEEFKKYELEKEHQRRDKMKNMTTEEKVTAEKEHEASHHRPHAKVHEPGHKAQLEEVWEEQDGFDAGSFDPKTFFHMHDKNGDGYWDYFEMETLFLHDLDKIYNESDPTTDMKERYEEMERMREHVEKYMDHDKDGLVSLKEYLMETEGEEFKKEKEWKPIIDEEQFTEDDFLDFERKYGDEHMESKKKDEGKEDKNKDKKSNEIHK